MLRCRAEERAKKWEMLDEYRFAPGGMINTKTFKATTDIVTKKYYERMSKADVEKWEEEQKKIKEENKRDDFFDEDEDFEDGFD